MQCAVRPTGPGREFAGFPIFPDVCVGHAYRLTSLTDYDERRRLAVFQIRHQGARYESNLPYACPRTG